MGFLERLFVRQREEGVKLSREEILQARPVTNPDVEKEEREEGAVFLTYPVEATGLARLMRRFSSSRHKELRRRFELDRAGADVWRLCDGSHSVGNIAAHIAQEYGVSAEEAEGSTVLYMRMLSERGLVALDLSGAVQAGENRFCP